MCQQRGYRRPEGLAGPGTGRERRQSERMRKPEFRVADGHRRRIKSSKDATGNLVRFKGAVFYLSYRCGHQCSGCPRPEAGHIEVEELNIGEMLVEKLARRAMAIRLLGKAWSFRLKPPGSEYRVLCQTRPGVRRLNPNARLDPRLLKGPRQTRSARKY